MESTTSPHLASHGASAGYDFGHVPDSMDDVTRDMTAVNGTSPLPRSLDININPSVGLADLPTTTDDLHSFIIPACSPANLEVPLEELRWDSLLDWGDTFEIPFNVPTLIDGEEAIPSPTSHPWQQTEGFRLQQVDMVEAKCVELQSYLRGSSASLPDGFIESHITRRNLVECIDLYGIHYQPVMPILHLPTFDLTTTQPVLLAAMLLVGACYSENLIPETAIVQYAIHVLVLIEDQPVSVCLRIMR